MSFKTISESEWEIMKVLWKHSPASTGDIIKEFQEINEWSPTTIKTFISRLLGKHLISFELHNNRRRYFPLMSEKECVENEMVATIHKIYGGKPNLTLPNFIFYGDNDKKYIDILAAAIEKDYEKSSSNLDFKFSEKQSIYLYSSQNRLQSALGYPNGPIWIKAGCPWGVLHMSPKSAFVNEDPSKILHHILVQLMVYKINSNIPDWLSQGIASYESKWLTKDRIDKVLMDYKNNINQNSIEYRNIDITTFKQNGGYEFSYLFVEFIVKKYGYKRIREFIENPMLCDNKIFQELNDALKVEFCKEAI